MLSPRPFYFLFGTVKISKIESAAVPPSGDSNGTPKKILFLYKH
jgi:hypothetical protein